MPTLDVRTIPPRDRHPLIFEAIDRLEVGETLRIVNDHDPSPLRYQLDATRPGQLSWSYDAEGPEEWRVDLTSRARVVDARPTIAAGGEPFEEILAAARLVRDGEVLVVVAPFEPVPLYEVLAAQGFSVVPDQLDGGDWRVTFVRR